MSHSQLLEVVARLHVDLAFRRAFLADRIAALASLGLDDADREALARLDPKAVTTMGRMADFHRWTRIQEHLAWADVTARPDLGPRLERFMERVEPGLLNRDEAIAFCRFLEQEPAGEPPYLGELARYERLRISIAWGIAPAEVEDFEFPIPAVLAAMGAAGWPPAERSPTRLSFKKVPGIPAVLVRG